MSRDTTDRDDGRRDDGRRGDGRRDDGRNEGAAHEPVADDGFVMGGSLRRLALKTTLQALLLGTVVLSVGTAVLLLQHEMRVVLDKLATEHFRTVNLSLSSLVRSDLGAVPRALRELQFLASEAYHEGVLSEGEEIRDQMVVQAVGTDLGSRVGFVDIEQAVYMVAYVNANGSVTLEIDSEDPDNAKPNIRVDADGRKHVLPNDGEAPTLYREEAWFRNALEAGDVSWTDFETLSNGDIGITASTLFQPSGASGPVGVFHIDVPLNDVERWLGELRAGDSGFVFLLDAERRVVVRPGADDDDEIKRRGWAEQVLELAGQRLIGKKREASEAVVIQDSVEVKGGADGVTEYHVAFTPFAVDGGLRLIAAMVVPEDDFLRLAWDRLSNTAMFAAVAIAVVVWFGGIVANRISAPILRIAHDLRGIARMEISDERTPGSFVREVETLGDAVDRMKSGLRSLERYIPPEVARQLVGRGEAASLGVERRELSIYVSDIAGFTSIAESADPATLVDELRIYFDAMTDTIRTHGGMIDKFMGDGILAYFNAPTDVEDHPVKVCRAALASQAWLDDNAASERATPIPMFQVRIGLGLGEVLVGNIGSTKRFGYTAIGDAVNVASRIEAVNKFYGTRIIAIAPLADRTGEAFEWRRLDRIAVVGRQGGTEIVELLGEKGAVAPELLTARDGYEAALDAYYQGDFDEAERRFEEAAALRPGDEAALAMARRSHKLHRDPPPKDWGGVYVFTKK